MKNTIKIVVDLKLTPVDGGETVKVEALGHTNRTDVMRAAEDAARHYSGGFYREAFAPLTLMSWPGCQSPVKKLTEGVTCRVSTTFGNNNESDPFVLDGTFVSQTFEII